MRGLMKNKSKIKEQTFTILQLLISEASANCLIKIITRIFSGSILSNGDVNISIRVTQRRENENNKISRQNDSFHLDGNQYSFLFFH